MLLNPGGVHHMCVRHPQHNKTYTMPACRLVRLAVGASSSSSSANTTSASSKPAARKAPVRKGKAVAKQADRQPARRPAQPQQPQPPQPFRDATSAGLEVGQTVTGTVLRVSAAGALVELQGAAGVAAFVPLQECSAASLTSPLEALHSGMEREFEVKQVQQQHAVLSLAALEEQQLQQRMCVLRDEGVILPVTVLEAVSSGGDFDEPGLRVEYKMSGSLRVPGFIPASLLKLTRGGGGMRALEGQELPVFAMGVSQTGVVNFTHRIAVHRLAASKCKAEVGDVLNGVVTSIKAYGAFVDIGDGATGLLHISNITHDRLTSVEQVLKVGDKLRALVIVVNKVKGRITLSTKKLEKEPGDFRRLSRKEFNDRADAQADVFNAALRGVSE